MDNKYQKFIEKAKEIYANEPTGHDFSHIERVLCHCKKILQEENADEEVVVISALFHDIHRVLSSKAGRHISAEEAMPEVERVLGGFDIDKEKLSKILYVIEQHDNKTDEKNIPIELQIIQDADILDSLGEIGLRRTLAYCKKNNIPVVNLSYDLDCKEYVPDINPISTCHYVTRTMVANFKRVHTKAAEQIGREKVSVMEEFVKKEIQKERNEGFLKYIKEAYAKARDLADGAKEYNIVRGRKHAVSGVAEDRFALYVAETLGQKARDLEFYIDYPISIVKEEGQTGRTKSFYPDLIVVKDGKILQLYDLKMDLGWCRNIDEWFKEKDDFMSMLCDGGKKCKIKWEDESGKVVEKVLVCGKNAKINYVVLSPTNISPKKKQQIENESRKYSRINFIELCSEGHLNSPSHKISEEGFDQLIDTFNF